MQSFQHFINTHFGLTHNEWSLLEDHLSYRTYKAGDEITFPDQIWTEIMFINSGIVRSYIINDQGKDFTRQFYFNTNESMVANLFLLDLTSMTTQLPSRRGFEVLQACEVTVFSRKALYSLYENYKKWEFIGRRMAELAYIDMESFYYDLLTKTPKERYVKLQTHMSKLLCQVPQYHIASYLGVTPVTLSRIRRDLKNEGRLRVDCSEAPLL